MILITVQSSYIKTNLNWKMSIHPMFRDAVNKHGPENRKKEHCVQRVKSIIPKMFQIVPCVITNIIMKISWKSTHRFNRSVANKHARGA